MGRLLSTYIRIKGLQLRYRVSNDSSYPNKVQEQFLLNLIKKNKFTVYGKKYSFDKINNYKDFKNNIPIVEYDDIELFINKIKNGETNVLTSDPVILFSITSGTTAEPKFIPITRQSLKRTQNLNHKWLSFSISDHPSFLKKKFLCITGAAIEGYSKCGIPYGSSSGMITTSLPSLLQKAFAVPIITSEIKEFDMRYFAMTRFAYEHSISLISTPNPLTLIKIAETANHSSENIIRSIHNGWLSESIKNMTDCIKSGINPKLISSIRPNKKRAAFLHKILENTGFLNPIDCWPNLKLIGCWLGGSIGFHSSELNKYYGNTPLRDIGYMASEGCITIPKKDSTPAGVISLQNHFYEFIPEEQIELSNPDILRIAELEDGCFYKILLTNENGLYRYDINDIVQVHGFYKKTPIIAFARKSGNVCNITGEKLHLNQVLQSIDKIQLEFNININQFRIIPDINLLRYEFFFDFSSEVSKDILQNKLLPELDKYLCLNNIEYAAKRTSKRLNPPIIHIMNFDWVSNTQNSHNQYNKRDIQYKWVQMSQTKINNDYKHILYSVEQKTMEI